MGNSGKRRLSAAIVGGGFGGIGAAIRLREAGVERITLYERSDSVGGVWRANTYPGAACDVPSHLYSFSFARGTNWSRRYAPQAEIRQYLNDLVDQYDLHSCVRCNTAVERATFDAERGTWEVTSSDGRSESYDLLITACGQLTNPAIPNLEGLERFAGRTFHSATWDHDYDLTGKRVAVVGTGASAIQFVPEVARQAASVCIFQRSAPWILPKFDRAYAAWEQRLFRAIPARVGIARAILFRLFEALTYGFTTRPWVLKPLAAASNRYRRHELGDNPNLLAQATPDYRIGCKRVLFTSEWYTTLKRPNVELITGTAPSVTENALVDAHGIEHEVDAIIWGTGFKSHDFVAPMEIRGLDGRELGEVWGDTPQAYLGTTVAGFPNMFILYGPNTNHGAGSVPYTHECQIDYILDAVDRLRAGGYRFIDLEPRVMNDWRAEMDTRSAATAWTRGGCSSWYLNRNGTNTNNWPGPWLEYKRRTQAIDPGEYRFVA